jgi:murein endopeptidase
LQNCKEETCEVCSSRTRLICEQCEHRRMHALRVRACERACVHPCVRALLCTNCLVQFRILRLVMPTHEHRDAWLCVLHATQLPT